MIDGMTGDERFFLSYAQGWRDKMRDEAMIVQLKTDPHSPDKFRANGPLSNLDAFYKTFAVKEGDRCIGRRRSGLASGNVPSFPRTRESVSFVA